MTTLIKVFEAPYERKNSIVADIRSELEENGIECFIATDFYKSDPLIWICVKAHNEHQAADIVKERVK